MKNFTFKINENNYSVKILSQEDNTINLEVNGTNYAVKMKENISVSKTPTLVRRPVKETGQQPVKVSPSVPTASNSSVTAPLPGVILSLNVKAGDTVKEGDVLLVLEAMKMENNIVAEASGVVKAVSVTIGQQVLQGATLVEME
ncbi:MAG: biotin/lipoyl-containing protein [Flavobacteriaceae bacterium]